MKRILNTLIIIWKALNIVYLREYHDLYVKTNIELLARKLCRQFCDIDCAHLFTPPSLMCQACSKISETSTHRYQRVAYSLKGNT